MKNALDPVSRSTELLFGLVMVLTFTLSLNAVEAGRSDVRLMLIGALGCNLAWGLIDAAMYLISTRSEKAIAARTVAALRAAGPTEDARKVVAAALPDFIASVLGPEDLERLRTRIAGLPEQAHLSRLDQADYQAALAIFLLVFVGTLPVVLPFVFLGEPEVALRVSNLVAIGLLFLAGWSLGRVWGRPWRVGLSMIVIGVALVLVALALGG